MIIIRFYNSNRKNAKELKCFRFHYDKPCAYTCLNYLHEILSYIVNNKPKFYTIQIFQTFKAHDMVYEFNFTSSQYRQYIKIYDIELVINNLISHAYIDVKYTISDDLIHAHHNEIIKQLIKKYYN